MLSPRHRPILFALVALIVIWVVVTVGYHFAQNAKVTPEGVSAYIASMDFSQLSGAEREAALQRLAAMLNALTLEERRRLRLDQTINKWFKEMTEAEKSEFLAATMPTGFKQSIAAFEQLPAEKRQQVVSQAVKQMKDTSDKMAANGQMPSGANGAALSPELQEQVTKIGLQSFYSQSSAETKAEMAPLLEEMQHTMESGRGLGRSQSQ